MTQIERAPGRPIGGRAFERRDIVEAAFEALAAGGYSGLSMRGVARSVGASLATVQRHFATKDELCGAAMDDFVADLDERVPLGPGVSLVDSLTALFDRGGDHPGLLVSVLCDRAPRHERRFANIAGRLAGRNAAVRAMIADRQQAGVVRDVDADALLLLLNVGVGAITSAPDAVREIYGFDLEDPAERRRLAEALTDILEGGLARG